MSLSEIATALARLLPLDGYFERLAKSLLARFVIPLLDNSAHLTVVTQSKSAESRSISFEPGPETTTSLQALTNFLSFVSFSTACRIHAARNTPAAINKLGCSRLGDLESAPTAFAVFARTRIAVFVSITA